MRKKKQTVDQRPTPYKSKQRSTSHQRLPGFLFPVENVNVVLTRTLSTRNKHAWHVDAHITYNFPMCRAALPSPCYAFRCACLLQRTQRLWRRVSESKRATKRYVRSMLQPPLSLSRVCLAETDGIVGVELWGWSRLSFHAWWCPARTTYPCLCFACRLFGYLFWIWLIVVASDTYKCQVLS